MTASSWPTRQRRRQAETAVRPPSGTQLEIAHGDHRATVVEVHNTYRERHLYPLRPERSDGTFSAAMDKDFYARLKRAIARHQVALVITVDDLEATAIDALELIPGFVRSEVRAVVGGGRMTRPSRPGWVPRHFRHAVLTYRTRARFRKTFAPDMRSSTL